MQLFIHALAARSRQKKTQASQAREKLVKNSALLTGYRKKGLFYYKSRGIGKSVNVNAAHLNNLFYEELCKYEYSKKHSVKLKEKIAHQLTEKLKDNFQEQKQTKKHLS